MLEKTENKGSFVFRGCERHDTGWPKSFAKRGIGGTPYIQQFGRAMRPKPELEVVISDFDYKTWLLEGYEGKSTAQAEPPKIKGFIHREESCRCVFCTPGLKGPEGMQGPAGVNFDNVLVPDIDDPDNPAWNYEVEPASGKDCDNPSDFPAWYVPVDLPYPLGYYKAENHSLGDGTLEGAEPIYDPGTNKPAVYTIKNVRALTRRAAHHSLNDGSRDSRWAVLDRRAKLFFRGIWNDFSYFAYAVPPFLLLWIGLPLLSLSMVIMKAMQP